MQNGNDDLVLAQMWYEAVTNTCYVPDEKKAVLHLLEGCVVELRRALISPRFSTEPAARAGERLVQAYFLSATMLEQTLTLLDRELPFRVADVVPATVLEELPERWSRLRNRFTAGFMAAFLDQVRQQKDELYTALIAAYKDHGTRLVGHCGVGCTATGPGNAGCVGMAMLTNDADQPADNHACPVMLQGTDDREGEW